MARGVAPLIATFRPAAATALAAPFLGSTKFARGSHCAAIAIALPVSFTRITAAPRSPGCLIVFVWIFASY